MLQPPVTLEHFQVLASKIQWILLFESATTKKVFNLLLDRRIKLKLHLKIKFFLKNFNKKKTTDEEGKMETQKARQNFFFYLKLKHD